MTLAVVTGAAGFIGSHVGQALAERGLSVIGTDFMSSDDRWKNLERARIDAFVEPEALAEWIAARPSGEIAAVFHQGACSATTEHDADYMMRRNYHYSVELAAAAARINVPFVYASSASVYGNTFVQGTDERAEDPLNVYAYSKYLFDRHVRRFLWNGPNTVTGLRYFNVYGEHEGHKGRMASVIHGFREQAQRDGVIRLFEGSGGFSNGEQRRDFVDVNDVVAVNLFFAFDRPANVIVDVGTGNPQPFNAIATVVADRYGAQIDYIPMPADLLGRYQHWTSARMRDLADAGWDHDRFTPLADGVVRVLEWLDAHDA